MKVLHFPKRSGYVAEYNRTMRLLFGDKFKIITKDGLKIMSRGVKYEKCFVDEVDEISKSTWGELGKMMLPTGDKYETKQ